LLSGQPTPKCVGNKSSETRTSDNDEQEDEDEDDADDLIEVIRNELKCERN
jgi:hypothetical protein